MHNLINNKKRTPEVNESHVEIQKNLVVAEDFKREKVC